MQIDDCFYFGFVKKIIKGNGIIIKPNVDDITKYENINFILLQENKNSNSLLPYKVKGIKIISNNQINIELNTSSNIEPHVGKAIYLPLQLLPKLDRNQFYYHEIIGFNLLDEKYGNLGRIESVLENKQVFFCVKKKGKELLIPIIDEFIKTVDKNKKIIYTQVPEGIQELYY